MHIFLLRWWHPVGLRKNLNSTGKIETDSAAGRRCVSCMCLKLHYSVFEKICAQHKYLYFTPRLKVMEACLQQKSMFLKSLHAKGTIIAKPWRNPRTKICIMTFMRSRYFDFSSLVNTGSQLI